MAMNDFANLKKFALLIEFFKKLWVMQILSESHSAYEGAFAFYISEEWFKLAKQWLRHNDFGITYSQCLKPGLIWILDTKQEFGF